MDSLKNYVCVINEECNQCDLCLPECPTGAIEEGDPIYSINPGVCTCCEGVYEEPVCIDQCVIVNAISKVPR